jgi:hypothetical protein
MNKRELSIIADASGGEIASPASHQFGDCEESKAMRKSRLSGTEASLLSQLARRELQEHYVV